MRSHWQWACLFLAINATVAVGQTEPLSVPNWPRASSQLRILLMPALQQEFELTEDQQADLKELQVELRNDPEIAKQMASITSVEFRKHRETEESRQKIKDTGLVIRQIEDKYKPKIAAILNAAQVERLQQVCWQSGLNGVLTDPVLIEKLNITSDQQEKIDQARREIQINPADPAYMALSLQEKHEIINSNEAKLQQSLMAVLTPEQHAEHTQLKGKLVDASVWEPRGSANSSRPSPAAPSSTSVETKVNWNASQSPMSNQNEMAIPFRLLGDPLIQSELNLSRQQESSIRALEKKYGLEKYSLGLNMKALPGEAAIDVAARQKETILKLNAVDEEFRVLLSEILTPEQNIRLWQICWQAAGGSALQDSVLASLLMITPDQQTQIDARLRQYRTERGETIEAILQKNREKTGARQIDYNGLKEAFDRDTMAFLTEEQRGQLKELLGTPFDVTQLSAPLKPRPRPDNPVGEP